MYVENPTTSLIKQEVCNDSEVQPQIIELKEGQIYRLANFGRPVKNIDKIQSVCRNAWSFMIKHYFPSVKKVHETGAKIIYPRYGSIYHKYVIPTLEILYGKKLNLYRIDDKSILFSNDDNRFALYFRELLDNIGDTNIRQLCEVNIRKKINKKHK